MFSSYNNKGQRPNLCSQLGKGLMKPRITGTGVFCFSGDAGDYDSTQLYFIAFITLSSIITVYEKKPLVFIITVVKHANKLCKYFFSTRDESDSIWSPLNLLS